MDELKTPTERAAETVKIIRGTTYREARDYESVMEQAIQHAIVVAVNEEVAHALVDVAYGAGRDQEIMAARQAIEAATRSGCSLCRVGDRPKKRKLNWNSDRATYWVHGARAEDCGCPAYLHNLLDLDDEALFSLIKEPTKEALAGVVVEADKSVETGPPYPVPDLPLDKQTWLDVTYNSITNDLAFNKLTADNLRQALTILADNVEHRVQAEERR